MSTINETQININVTNLQPNYTALGMGSVPPGTTLAAGIGAIEKVLIAQLAASWPATAAAYVPTQTNDGIMEPLTAAVAGSVPACVTQQIINSLNGWNLPYSTAAVNEMATEITQNIVSNAGITGTFYGNTTLSNGGETLYWGVGYTTAIVINPDTQGVIYAFTASLGL